MKNIIEFGDCREIMRQWAEEGVKAQMCVTSPPYFGLRDYGVDGQIGLEKTPEEYIAGMVDVFRCVRDVLADDGVLWLNIGDSYCGTGDKGNYKDPKYSDGRNGQAVSITKKLTGYKQKDLIGIPWMLAFALRADGWYLRQDIIWAKPNPMPEPVRDRCTKSHEYIFLLSKSQKYYYDNDSIRTPLKEVTKKRVESGWSCDRANISKNGAQGIHTDKMGTRFAPEKGANKRSVWNVATQSYKGAHFATFPTALIEPCILAGSREGDVVLDPFMGSGTTAQVALQHGRSYLGCELNKEYRELQNNRIKTRYQNER